MRRTSLVVVLLACGCTDAQQRVRARHAEIFQCRPAWVEVKRIGFEAGRDRYIAQGCGHAVLYTCGPERRPCDTGAERVEAPAAGSP